LQRLKAGIFILVEFLSLFLGRQNIPRILPSGYQADHTLVRKAPSYRAHHEAAIRIPFKAPPRAPIPMPLCNPLLKEDHPLEHSHSDPKPPSQICRNPSQDPCQLFQVFSRSLNSKTSNQGTSHVKSELQPGTADPG
jgi:hypothetical protein